MRRSDGDVGPRQCRRPRNWSSTVQSRQPICRYARRSSRSWPTRPSAPLVRNNLRLLYGSWLARHALYDEAGRAARRLAGTGTTWWIPPRSCSIRPWRHIDSSRKRSAFRWWAPLGKRSALPKRYATVAGLMQHDIEPLKPDSLDEIARMMDDVRRRLDLGRAGKKVRDEEAEIIAKLDKKIDDLEKQQKQQQQQQQQKDQARTNRPIRPSRARPPATSRPPTRWIRRIWARRNSWGNLPPKQRQQALQQIGRDLPSHFRDTIEEYFKRLAQDGNE